MLAAPSWSWASCEGPINYHQAVSETCQPLAQFISVETDLVGDNPFGQVTGGQVLLRGFLFPVDSEATQIIHELDCRQGIDLASPIYFLPLALTQRKGKAPRDFHGIYVQAIERIETSHPRKYKRIGVDRLCGNPKLGNIIPTAFFPGGLGEEAWEILMGDYPLENHGEEVMLI